MHAGSYRRTDASPPLPALARRAVEVRSPERRMLSHPPVKVECQTRGNRATSSSDPCGAAWQREGKGLSEATTRPHRQPARPRRAEGEPAILTGWRLRVVMAWRVLRDGDLSTGKRQPLCEHDAGLRRRDMTQNAPTPSRTRAVAPGLSYLGTHARWERGRWAAKSTERGGHTTPTRDGGNGSGPAEQAGGGPAPQATGPASTAGTGQGDGRTGEADLGFEREGVCPTRCGRPRRDRGRGRRRGPVRAFGAARLVVPATGTSTTRLRKLWRSKPPSLSTTTAPF
jgi:hypothetical protein